MNHITTMIWVLRCIESCETKAQLEGANRLIEFYYNIFNHLYFYKFLKSKFREHKKTLNYE